MIKDTVILELSNEDILRLTNKSVLDKLNKWADKYGFHNHILKGKLEISLNEINKREQTDGEERRS
jgi:hypothetical protein